MDSNRVLRSRDLAASVSDPNRSRYYVTVFCAQVLGSAPGTQRTVLLYPGEKHCTWSIGLFFTSFMVSNDIFFIRQDLLDRFEEPEHLAAEEQWRSYRIETGYVQT